MCDLNWSSQNSVGYNRLKLERLNIIELRTSGISLLFVTVELFGVAVKWQDDNGLAYVLKKENRRIICGNSTFLCYCVLEYKAVAPPRSIKRAWKSWILRTLLKSLELRTYQRCWPDVKIIVGLVKLWMLTGSVSFDVEMDLSTMKLKLLLYRHLKRRRRLGLIASGLITFLMLKYVCECPLVLLCTEN